jgi:UDP-glucose 4-epimerase
LIGEITEQACPRNLHPYAASHLAGEAAVLGASQRAEIHGVVLRLSNVFGAPARREVSCWNLVVNDLCRQAVETRKLVLRTSGTQYRDFVAMQHVCRVVDYLTCRSCEYTEPLLFNVGAGLTRSIYQIAELVQLRCARLFGFEPLIQRPPHEGEPPAVPFVYCVERLAAEGIVFDSNTILEEMDGLMTFCAKNRNVTLN